MPMGSSPLEFANALTERRSRTTKALDVLFRRPINLRNHAHIGDLRRSGYLNVLATWIKNELKTRGVVKPQEFRHINEWPNTHKERLRRAMIHAIDNNVKMRFFWELYGGSNEQTKIVPDPLPRNGTITVTFVSPQSRVRVSTAPSTFGEIMVDVGS